jgi:putative flippase GtrA
MVPEPTDADSRPSRVPAVMRRLIPPVLVQFVKFGIVGISNTLLTFAVYTLLLKGFGVWYLAASAIGFAAGAVNGFLLNRRWTFRGHVGDALTPVRWTIVQLCGLGINEGLLYLFVHDAGIDKLLAQALATGVVTITTFTANRAWTFRTPAVPAVDSDG